MSTVESIESLHATLEPLEALRGEHNQLEEWVNDSFMALEKLHEDLSIWQSELARKQTEIDLREDSLDRCEQQGSYLDEEVAQWKQDLEEAREEVRQLEEESGEQLEAVEQLERRSAELEQELGTARQRSEEVAAALAEERERTSDEQHLWKEEFRQLRQLLQQQHAFVAERLGSDAAPGELALPPVAVDADGSSRSAELRRRAEARRAAKRGTQPDAEESSES